MQRKRYTTLEKITALNCLALMVHLCFPTWLIRNADWVATVILAVDVAIVYSFWEFLRLVVFGMPEDDCSE